MLRACSFVSLNGWCFVYIFNLNKKKLKNVERYQRLDLDCKLYIMIQAVDKLSTLKS